MSDVPKEQIDQPESVPPPSEKLVALPAVEPPAIATGSGDVAGRELRSPNKKSKLASVLKRVAWRATGVYVWFILLKRLFTGHAAGDLQLSNRIAAYLSSMGFAPIDENHLTTIIKVGWVLVVTAFKPIEIIGLVIYLAFFWMLPLMLYLTYGMDTGSTSTPNTDKQFGLTANNQRRLAIPVCGLMLLAWLVLFGDAASKKPMILGALLSGVLFLLFAVRAFQRVRPTYDPDPNFLRAAKLAGLVFLKIAGEQTKDKTLKTKNQAILYQRTYRPIKRFYRRLAILTRGTRGRNRIYLFVLAEYVASLVLLAAATLLFWAMADKAVLAPTTLPLSYFFGLAASSVFPVVPPIVPSSTLPKIMLFGPSVSAWILFVLYVGPASSNLSYRQKGYARNVRTAHQIFRKFTVSYTNYLRYLEIMVKKLP